MKGKCDITANGMAAHLIHCWMIFLLPANTQVCRRCSEDMRSMAEASVNFKNDATLCCKTANNVDFFLGSGLKRID